MKEYKDYKYLTKAISLPNGKRKYIRAKTKRELEKKVMLFMVELGRASERSLTTVDSDTTVEELAALWLNSVKRPSVRPQTFQVYEGQVNNHILPAIGDMKVSAVKYLHVIDVVNSHGYGTKNGNRALMTTIRALFKFAVDNDIIPKSPVPARFSPTGTTGKEDRPLTPEQTKDLLDCCKKSPDPNVYLFTYLALVTGMRRGELGALRWDCVDLQQGLVHVRRQLVDYNDSITDELKTEAAKRDIPIAPETVAVLRRAKAVSRSTYVLGGTCDGHISSNDVARYNRVWNKSGITTATIHPHLFRKTFATRMIESGADPKRVQYLLGHTTLDMTLGIYAKYDQESQAEKTRELISDVFDGYVAMLQ